MSFIIFTGVVQAKVEPFGADKDSVIEPKCVSSVSRVHVEHKITWHSLKRGDFRFNCQELEFDRVEAANISFDIALNYRDSASTLQKRIAYIDQTLWFLRLGFGGLS
jgi:hypothetical protein